MKLVPLEDLPSLHSLKLNQVNGTKLQFKLYMDNFILPVIRLFLGNLICQNTSLSGIPVVQRQKVLSYHR